MNKNDKIYILLATLIAIVSIVLYKLYDDGVFKLPSVDSSKVEEVVQPSKIKKYFGNTDDKTIEEMTGPGPNN